MKLMVHQPESVFTFCPAVTIIAAAVAVAGFSSAAAQRAVAQTRDHSVRVMGV